MQTTSLQKSLKIVGVAICLLVGLAIPFAIAAWLRLLHWDDAIGGWLGLFAINIVGMIWRAKKGGE